MFKRFEKFVAELSQLITFVGTVQTYFTRIYHEKKLKIELKFLEGTCENKGWVPKVEKSIDQLFTIGKYKDAAKAVRDAGNALGLEEPFQVVKQILNSSDESGSFQMLKMKDVNDDLIKAGESFSSWGGKEIEVLGELPVCGNLLSWLKANINDRNDLKTFYDLATISAGESDLELDRVSHFYQSVSGYAPLILDLNIKNCSFGQFHLACKAVFATLTADPHMAEKLVDSNRNLEWIKACKEQQGSVEQTSLTMVAKINETGIFHICPDGNGATKNLDAIIKLSYNKVSNEDDESRVDLTLEQLKELNSKLMLITAGTQGKKDVDRFSRILSLVEQVGRLYLDLLRAGCHLFSRWNMKVESKFSGDLLRGHHEVEAELERVAEFLKATLDEWSSHVSKLRNNHPSLNFFTTDQLVLLSGQMARVSHTDELLSLEATMLLKLLATDLTQSELSRFIQTSLKNQAIVDGSVASNDDDEDLVYNDYEEDDLFDPFEELKSKTEYKLLCDDFDSSTALASLIKCKSHNMVELTEWCFEEHSKEEVLQILRGHQFEYKRNNFIQESEQPEGIPDISLVNNIQEGRLLSEQFEAVWTQFMGKVESLEMKDFLCFQSLAKCLEDLSSAHASHPKRKIFSQVRQGCPNLVVCPEAEIYDLALSFYMNDAEKPLPSLDEVLICQKETPLESIALVLML